MLVKVDIGLDTCDAIQESLSEFKDRLDNLAASIGATPETAQIKIEFDGGWDDDYGTIEAFIWRDETEAETEAREAAEAARSARCEAERKAQREAYERATYAALKAKFGDAV